MFWVVLFGVPSVGWRSDYQRLSSRPIDTRSTIAHRAGRLPIDAAVQQLLAEMDRHRATAALWRQQLQIAKRHPAEVDQDHIGLRSSDGLRSLLEECDRGTGLATYRGPGNQQQAPEDRESADTRRRAIVAVHDWYSIVVIAVCTPAAGPTPGVRDLQKFA